MSVKTAFIACGVKESVAAREAPLAERAMIEFAITNQRRAAAFLAQVLEESGRLQFFEEIASGAEYEGRRDLGNTHPGDGRRYKGRGPIQLTGRSNYAWAGKALGINLVNSPTIASQHAIGWRIAGLYWKSRGLNGLADAGDFHQITQRINGGQNGASVREMFWARCKKVDCVPLNRWAGYTESEQRWIKEYDGLLHAHANLARRKTLRYVMGRQAQGIEAAAKKTGWDKANRRRRYRSLAARSGLS